MTQGSQLRHKMMLEIGIVELLSVSLDDENIVESRNEIVKICKEENSLSDKPDVSSKIMDRCLNSVQSNEILPSFTTFKRSSSKSSLDSHSSTPSQEEIESDCDSHVQPTQTLRTENVKRKQKMKFDEYADYAPDFKNFNSILASQDDFWKATIVAMEMDRRLGLELGIGIGT